MITDSQYSINSSLDFTIELNTIIKCLITIWNTILIIYLLPLFDFNSTINLIFIIVSILSILSSTIPNKYFQKLAGSLITLIGIITTGLGIYCLITTYNKERNEYWRIAMAISVIFFSLAVSILLTGWFILYNSGMITKKNFYFKRVSEIDEEFQQRRNSVDILV